MDFWNMITGRDMNRQWKAFESRAKKLPADYQAAWREINGFLWQRSDFSGRKITRILEGVLELFEEAGSQERSAQEVLGGDIKGFCAALAGEEGVMSFRDQWRKQLNRSILRKLGR